MTKSLFVFTNDDAGMEQPFLFAELLDFLAAQQVPATFFVVPFADGVPLDQKPEWVELLQRALAEGHELQHHAWRHDSCFEFGMPPYFMLDIIPDAKAGYAIAPEEFTRHHGYDTLRTKLEEGRVILERVLGYTPRGFRSPCLSACDALYQALHDLEFAWATNDVINPLGWRYINRDYSTGEEWHTDFPPRPYRRPGSVIEVPIHSEYTWYLTADDVDRHTALAQADLDRAAGSGDSFVTLSHYFAMTGEWRAGLDVYRRLFDHARQRGEIRFATMSTLAQQAPHIRR